MFHVLPTSSRTEGPSDPLRISPPSKPQPQPRHLIRSELLTTTPPPTSVVDLFLSYGDDLCRHHLRSALSYTTCTAVTAVSAATSEFPVSSAVGSDLCWLRPTGCLAKILPVTSENVQGDNRRNLGHTTPKIPNWTDLEIFQSRRVLREPTPRLHPWAQTQGPTRRRQPWARSRGPTSRRRQPWARSPDPTSRRRPSPSAPSKPLRSWPTTLRCFCTKVQEKRQNIGNHFQTFVSACLGHVKLGGRVGPGRGERYSLRHETPDSTLQPIIDGRKYVDACMPSGGEMGVWRQTQRTWMLTDTLAAVVWGREIPQPTRL